MQLFESGVAQFGDVRIDTTKHYCEWVIRLQRQWLDQTLLGLRIDGGAWTSMTPMRSGRATGRAIAARCRTPDQVDRIAGLHADSLEAIERMRRCTTSPSSPRPARDRRGTRDAAKLWGITSARSPPHYGGMVAQRRGVLALSIGEAQVFPVRSPQAHRGRAGREHPYYFTRWGKSYRLATRVDHGFQGVRQSLEA